MPTGESRFVLRADSDQYVGEVSKAEKSTRKLDKSQSAAGKSAKKLGDKSKSIDKLSKSFSGMGRIVAALGIGVAFKKMVENTARQEQAIAQLNNTLESTELAAGKASEELINTAASLQKITTYGDEAIIEMQSLLLTFKDIKGDNFDRTTVAVLDMATAMKIDLKSASIQLGKALNDPARNLSALTRSGIQFTAAQTDMIKAMQASGNVAGAQTIILKELESQFGGSAEAARDTLGGAISGLSNAFNDLFEAENKTTKSLKTNLNALEKVITSQGFKDGLTFLSNSLAAIFGLLGDVVEAGQAFTGWLSELSIDLFTDDLDRMGEELERTLTSYDLLNEIKVKSVRIEQDLRVAVDDQAKSLDQLQEIVVTATKKEQIFTQAMAGASVVAKDLGVDLAETKDATESLSTTTATAGKEVGSVWGDLVGDTVNSFLDMSTSIEDIFKNMLKKLIQMTITNPISVSLTAALDGSGGIGSLFSGGGAGDGAGGIGSIFAAGASSLWSTGKEFFSAGAEYVSGLFGQGAAQFGQFGTGQTIGSLGNTAITNGGFGTITEGGTSAAGGFSAASAGWAALAVGIYNTFNDLSDGLYGIGSVITGDNLNQKYGDSLGGLGQILFPSSSITDPLGIFDSISGGKRAGKEGNDINFATGEVESFNREHTKEFREAVDGITGSLIGFSQLLGGSSAQLKVTAHGEDGLKLGIDGKDTKFVDAAELVAAGFKELIRHAIDLEPHIQNLLLGFQGTAEQTIAFSSSIISLSELIKTNPVDVAVQEFAISQDAAANSLFRVYGKQQRVFSKMVENFDGSASAAAELNNALIQNKAAAYQLAIGIQQIAEAINVSFADTANYFRDSVLTQAELQKARLNERQSIRDSISGMVDPDEINTASARLDELSREIFSNFDPEKQAAQAEFFAAGAEADSAQFQRRLDLALDSVSERESEANFQLNEMLTGVTQKMDNSADKQLEAARINLMAAKIAAGDSPTGRSLQRVP